MGKRWMPPRSGRKSLLNIRASGRILMSIRGNVWIRLQKLRKNCILGRKIGRSRCRRSREEDALMKRKAILVASTRSNTYDIKTILIKLYPILQTYDVYMV